MFYNLKLHLNYIVDNYIFNEISGMVSQTDLFYSFAIITMEYFACAQSASSMSILVPSD